MHKFYADDINIMRYTKKARHINITWYGIQNNSCLYYNVAMCNETEHLYRLRQEATCLPKHSWVLWSVFFGVRGPCVGKALSVVANELSGRTEIISRLPTISPETMYSWLQWVGISSVAMVRSRTSEDSSYVRQLIWNWIVYKRGWGKIQIQLIQVTQLNQFLVLRTRHSR
jgi:hypothetical protein